MTWQADAIRIQTEGVAAMSAFSEGISSLYATTGQVSDLCRTLLQINAADSAPEQLASLGLVIDEMCQFLQSWLARTDSQTMRESFLRIWGDLEDIHKHGTRFRVVASLTAINATSDSAKMDDFIEELRAVPAQISEAVDVLLRHLATVGISVQDAVEAAQAGLVAMTHARRILTRHSDDSSAIFQQIAQSRRAMERIGTQYLTQSQEQTKALVHGFQYSDFFAQRLDHVAQLLAREAEFGPAARLLAAAQLLSLAEHGRETVSGIRAALRAQSVSTVRFTADFTDQGRIGAAGTIGLQTIFGAVLGFRQKAMPVIAKSVASSRQVLAEIRKCSDSFAGLVEMSGVMDLAAINARLGASREDRARAAMAFLSQAVIEGASSCRDILTKSADGLAMVATVQDMDMLDRLVDCVARFNAAVDSCQDGLNASEDRIRSLAQTMAEISRLIGEADALVRTCHATAEVLTGIVGQIDSFASKLAEGVTPPETWPDLSAIYDSYTIQAEREAHDRLLGRPVRVPPTPAALALDDILF